MTVHAARRDRLRGVLAERDIDAALITSLVNVRYLTGYTGSNGALLVGRDTEHIASDDRYRLQVQDECPDLDLVIDREVARALVDKARDLSFTRVGFEEHVVTVAGHDALTQRADGDVALVRIGSAVEQLRAVKDENEIALLRQACAIADAAFADLLAMVRPGLTEKAVARFLEDRMRDHGAAGPSFDTIVATGPNSAVPHHSPTERPLAAGDFVKVDFGALFGGYHSDMTRTVVVGPPADWQRDVYDVVRAAQAAGRAGVLPGADCRDLDGRARSVIDESAFAGRFMHGLGHGVGLEIHEAPGIGPTADGRLAEAMVVTVEPGVYLQDRGGVRIEDTVVVRSGGAEILTQSPRDLLSV